MTQLCNKPIHYNVHNILNVRSNITNIIPSCFEDCNQVSDPDLTIIVGDDVQFPDCFGNDFLKTNRIFLSDVSNYTKIFYSLNRFLQGLNYQLNDSIAPDLSLFLTNSLIPLKLLLKQCSFVHAACLDRDGDGLLIVAPPDTGKTYTTLSLNRLGFKFLSDDLTIIKGNRAYSWPKALTINPLHLRKFGISTPFSDQLKLKTRQTINRLPFLASCRDGLEIQSNKLLSNFAKETTIKNICFLDKGIEKVQELDSKIGFKKLISGSQEIQIFGNSLICQYFYNNPTNLQGFSELWSLRNKIYNDIAKNANIFSVKSNTSSFPELILNNIY